MPRNIKVDVLARVEGEGALYLNFKNGQVADVQLNIFEPPRFFEALLRGRHYNEAHDITSRICGICPIAYQMSAVHAMEDAFGVKVEGPLRALRRLLYCGEWIESHVLHVYMLHAPDFLGYPDAITMAKDHPAIVERGLQLKKIGNEIVELLGGRAVHPVNVRVGGFYKVPHKRDFQHLAERLKWARDAALETVRWTAALNFPEFEQDYEFVALRHENEYPFNEGRLVSNRGLNISPHGFDAHFAEQHVAHSNALHCVLKERGAYFTGPMARYNLNFDKLSPQTKMVHNTRRKTQPWKSGLPVDFVPAERSVIPGLALLKRARRKLFGEYAFLGTYNDHPDRKQEQFFFGLLRECVENGLVSEALLKDAMQHNFVRHDAFEVMKRTPPLAQVLQKAA